MPIQILSNQLANQIAAGEVVERPSSVVKELVENSIDAGATNIEIEIEKGGHKRVCIRDNGCGITKDELELALSRHATSKIVELQDLESIDSLGFRGEALASISSVARLTLTSKPADQQQAWQAYAEGRDMQVVVQPAAHPNGTSIDVVDLFFNTPARRKFLRTEKTEFAHIDEIVKRIALSRFDVSISLKHNGKVVRKYPAVKSKDLWHKRVANVCGKNFVDTAVLINNDFEQLHLSGWHCAPGEGRPQSDLQYFFVNGRVMRDKLINHAIRQAYEGVIDPNSHPAFVLYLELPATQVDVNVHPAKHEVRFHQSRVVHDFIFRVISHGLNSAFEPQSDNQQAILSDLQNSTTLEQTKPNHDYIRPLVREVDPHGGAAQSLVDRDIHTNAGGQQSANTSGHSQSHYRPKPPDANLSSAAANYQALMASKQHPSGQHSPAHYSWLPVDERFVLLKQDRSFIALDCVAISAVKLRLEFEANQPIKQPLLMPVSIALKNANSDQIEQAIENTTACGVELLFINQRLMIRQVPSGMRGLDWTSILSGVIDYLESPSSEFDDLAAYLCMLICKQKQKNLMTDDSDVSLILQWLFEQTNDADLVKQHGRDVSLQNWIQKHYE
ncbi:DNA mismatch repair endonuclease MutL [Aliiglaciecola sp.]|nr:DNA mismatch repair endonuclease MutL [Aliiglaciecola sp.]